MSNNPKENYCLNCNQDFPSDHKPEQEIFCSNCGQSSKDSKLSFWRLIQDGLSNLFNLDSRLVHTVKDIIYPSKLTKTYIAGKRKYYVNPVRLFIFTLIALITSVIWVADFQDIHFNDMNIYTRAEDSNMLDNFNEIVDTISVDNKDEVADSIRSILFKDVKGKSTDTIGISGGIMLFNWTESIKEYGISAFDAVHLTNDQIYKKYKIDDFYQKVSVSQYIRINTDPGGAIAFMVKNMTWAVIITILFMSFLLKLLYIRGRYYMVEHSVLMLNSHSFVFVLIGLSILLYQLGVTALPYYEDNLDFILLIACTLLIFSVQFLAIKKYYIHNVFMTLLIQSIINTAYIFIFSFSTMFVAIISVFLY